MYMANANILHWGPNATYINADTRWGLVLRVYVRGNNNFVFRIGGKANFSIFRYQHVGIANANFRVG